MTADRSTALPPKTFKERAELLARKQGMVPAVRAEHKHGIVFVALSPELIRDDPAHPTPHWRGVWFVAASDSSVDYGKDLYFDWDHDLADGMTEDTRRQARINALLVDAAQFLEARHAVAR